MDQALFVFEPLTTSEQATFWVSLLLSLGCLTAMILSFRNPGTGDHRNRRLLVAMLLFFAFLITGSTAFFSGWSLRRTGPVLIFPDAIELPAAKVPFTVLRNAAIHTDRQKSIINPTLSRGATQFLVVEEKTGKAYVLSEDNYPISEILGKLRETVAKWERDQEEREEK